MPYKENQQDYIGFLPQIRQVTFAEELINRIFPEQIMQTANNNPDFFNGRAIFAVIHDIVRKINFIVIRKLSGPLIISRAVNKMIGYGNNTKLKETMGKEIIILVNTKNLPPAELELKVRTPVILLRNYNSTDSFCNGARIIVSRIENNRFFLYYIQKAPYRLTRDFPESQVNFQRGGIVLKSETVTVSRFVIFQNDRE